MEGFKEFQGKDLDSAIEEACGYFNTAREKLEIEILQDAKSGIFGIVGARKAKVRARRAHLREAVESILGKKGAAAPDEEGESAGAAPRIPEKNARQERPRRGRSRARSAGAKTPLPLPLKSLVPARRRRPSPARLPLGKWTRRPRPRRPSVPHRSRKWVPALTSLRLGTRIVLKAKARSGKPRAPQAVTRPARKHAQAGGGNPAALPGVPGPGARKAALEAGKERPARDWICLGRIWTKPVKVCP